ncbi:hypothetical protein M5D96_014039 [Drosophila gunungcola]|uniref:polynucleotide adenylyltransferase n=1 Tax=Drosophila gunungcola TaxID=103775 RepID=A0A9P9YA88_9MUSC|nr:hypothetical protein M5D96_014039 [Drosophila gunungcola]
MYATRVAGDMKIFAADVAESSATETCSTPVQQQQQLQQLEFRSRNSAGSPAPKPGQCHLKFGKYNNKAANQASSCHSSNTESNKGQQQQQLQYCSNSNSWARKKYFGSSNGSSNGSSLQQQQLQSTYFQRQQQQQQQQQEQQTLNNNNVLMKNQNLVQPQLTDCQPSESNSNSNSSSNGNSSNRMAAKPAKWLNDNSSSNINNNIIGCRNTTNNIGSKKRNPSADATAAYYRKCPESLSPETAAESTGKEAAVAGPGQTSPSAAGSSTESGTETSAAKNQDQGHAQEPDKQRPRQQPLSFWKTNYPQPAASQQKNQQKTIEILASSNFNAAHRRMQGGGGKNGYYHNNYHPLAGEGGSTPTRSEHQNIYNLTYIHVDMEPSSETVASTAGTTPVVKPSLLNKPTTAHVRNMFAPPPLAMIGGHNLLSPVTGATITTTTTPTKMISCAQLDEAITAAAASGGDPSTSSPSFNQAVPFIIPSQQQQQQQQQPHLIPNCSTSQTQPQPLPPPPQVFFHFGDGFCNPGQGHQAPPAPVWAHSRSPCYQSSYGSSCSLNGIGNGNSPHSKDGNAVGLRPGSPALSTSSLGSESHWSGTSNRSRLGHGGHLSISPTPSALGSAQLSPHLHQPHQQLQQHPPPLVTHHPHGQLNGHAMTPFIPHRPHPPPPVSSPNPTAGATAGGPWYELVLPPDRYLAQARNTEVAVQPEKLICMCKYDNLSADIWKRFRGAQQTQQKFKLKMRLWRYLFLWMNQPMFERYRICLVGSTITGFGTDSSDIDMCLLPERGVPPHPHPHQHQYHQHQHQHHHYHNEKRTEALIILTLFNAVLKDTEVFQDFNLIEARVPILRFKDITNGIEVDLNFNNCVGIKNTYLLQLYAQLDWRTRPLVVIVKLWAQYHDINDAKRMTISSYSLVLMVLHYLQHACVPHVLPCLHTLYPEKFQLGQQDCLDLDLIEPIEPYQALNSQTLGEHLLGFFKYYSSFDFRNLAISIRTGGVLPVSTCRMAKSPKNDVYQWKELNIEEPFDLSNTARSVYDYATFERVKAVFLASARRLDHTLDLATVFRPIHHVQAQAQAQAQEGFPQQQFADHQLHYPNPSQPRTAGGGAAPGSSKLSPDAATTFAEPTAAHVV